MKWKKRAISTPGLIAMMNGDDTGSEEDLLDASQDIAEL